MADTFPEDMQGPAPDLNKLAADHVGQIYDVKNLSRLEQVIANAIQTALVNSLGAVISSAGGISLLIGNLVAKAEEVAAPVLAPMMAKLLENAFGVKASASSLGRINNAAGRHEIGQAIGASVLGTLEGGSGDLAPGKDSAEKLIGMLAHFAMSSWADGQVLEWVFSLCGFLHELQGLGELAPAIIQATGLDEIGRVGLRPLATVTVATPLQWYANKTYRPNLLSEGDILKAFLRGDYSGAEVAEELSRLGYSDKRQDMLLKSAYKSVSLDDLLVLVRDGQIDRGFVLASLRTQGYDEATAQLALHAAETKRLASIQDNSLGALQSAYADRRISDGEFSQFLSAIIVDEAERGLFEVAARTIRDVNTKRLSPGQAEACVKAGVLPMAAYREALALDGYDPESALALELLLETEIHKDIDVEELRKRKEAERAAAIAAKAAADAKKQADAEQQRLLARRGPLAELVRAAVRRLIPIARVVEVLAASYDADTVQIYVDDITTQIADADEQQRKADDAKKRAAIRHIDVGSFEQAVLEDVLTLDQFRRQLDTLSFDAADADVLTATLRQRKADLDAAKKKRAEADSAAKRQSIDLSRFEQLVRRGVRSLGDYDALLQSLDFDDASRAAMVQLLQLHIDDDVAAAKKRAELAAVDPAKGLALDQYRRAVILGLKTFDDFQTWLLQQKYTTDAQAVLVAELRDDVVQADAARRKREAPAAGGGAPAIPLSTVARAVRLGIVPPALYQQRLIDAGWSSDDIAIEMALLIQEIADVVAAKTKQAQRDAPAPPPTLTLAELATAARADVLPIAAYQARAHALGYSNDDVETLVRVLQVSVDAAADARARRAELEAKRAPVGPSLADLRAQVLAGELTLEAYVARLTAAGLDPVDVDMLASLLADELAAG
jgi:hypothetical protein